MFWLRLLDHNIFFLTPRSLVLYLCKKTPISAGSFQHKATYMCKHLQNQSSERTQFYSLYSTVFPRIKTLLVFYNTTSYLVCLFFLFFQYGHVFFQNFHNLSRIFVRFTKQRHGFSSPGFLPSGQKRTALNQMRNKNSF